MKIKNIRKISDKEYICDIKHEIHGWIPYTAVPNTGEERMQEIFEECDSKKRDLAEDIIIERNVRNIQNRFENILEGFTRKYTQQERDMWDLKRSEAEKVVSGSHSEILDVEASISGENVLDIAKKIIKKSNEYRIAVVKIETLKRNLEKDIVELKTLKQLDDFNSKYGDILNSLEG